MSGRHGILALLCAVSTITFLDRLALPVAEPRMRAELHLTAGQWGWVLSAYILANALFEIPSGALGDKTGRRRELTRIAVWWSTFTAATGWCRSFAQIAGARFLFGSGAAGAYPNAAGVIASRFPQREHARAQGYLWGAGRLGGALAPLLLVPLERHCGWRPIFWVLGGVGLLWSAAWWFWYRDLPAETAPDAPRPRASVPWPVLFRSPQLWMIAAAYFCYAWGSWFYFGWFPTWLVRGAGFSISQMGLFASFPFLMGMLGNLAGGALSERLVARHGRRRAYRAVTSLCLLATGGLLLAMSAVHAHPAVVALAALGFGVMDLMLPAAWAMCMSIGGPYQGTATGLMNTAGNLGGWVCTVVFGYAVQATGNYNLPLRGVAAMVALSALLFAGLDCTRGVAEAAP